MEATKKTMIENLHTALQNGVVKFQFKKKNGKIRTAYGTTNKEVLENNYSFKGGDGPSTYGYTSYWDMEKNDWRCFNNNMIIAIL